MKKDRNFKSEVLCGNQLSLELPNTLEDAFDDAIFCLTGKNGFGNRQALPITPELLSKHILLLGGIGTGKTNAFYGMISKIKEQMTDEDVMVIFDTKGDFYDSFFQPGDVVISNDKTATGSSGANFWNIFNEVASDSRGKEAITEIARMLFAEACEKTNQVFFPNAARGIFEACLYHFMKGNPCERTNQDLMEYIQSVTSWELRDMLLQYPDFRSLTSYIASDDSPQTQGVLSELQQVCRDIFIGNFAEAGTLSVRDIVRKKGGKTLFIEYDLSVGKILTPVYSLLFDLASILA